jgi:hypothetical protein
MYIFILIATLLCTDHQAYAQNKPERINELLDESLNLIGGYYGKETNNRTKKIVDEINKIKADESRKQYIASSINADDKDCGVYKKLGVLIGGLFIVDEFFKFEDVKQNLPVVSISSKNQFNPSKGEITYTVCNLSNNSSSLVQGINIGIHEFSHALRFIRNKKTDGDEVYRGGMLSTLVLSELATCYNIVSYGIPFKQQDSSVDIASYWSATLRNITTLPTQSKNSAYVIKKEYIAYIMCPWIYNTYITNKKNVKDIFDLSVEIDAYTGTDLKRFSLLYWSISKQPEDRSSELKNDYIDMFTESISKPKEAGKETLYKYIGSSGIGSIRILKNSNKIYAEKTPEATTATADGNWYYEIPQNIDVDDVLSNGLGMQKSNQLRSTVEEKFKSVIKDLKAQAAGSISEHDFLKVFTKSMDKHFGSPYKYTDVPAGYM